MENRWNWKGWLAAAAVLAVAGGVCARAAQVENVRAQQRPRSRVVDVWYDLVSEEGGVFEVSLAIGGGGVEPPLSTVGGDIGANIIPGRNKKIEWDAGADWAQHVQSNFVATVTATRSDADTGPSKGMVRIPGGTNSGTDGYCGAYSLTVKSFYMDKTEVTYAHWQRVYNWAIAHGYSFGAGQGKGANHPVHSVSWDSCVKWCNARSEMEGRTPAYTKNGVVYRTGTNKDQNLEVNLDGTGYRLPTEEEWEYAARGGLRGRRFPWGDTISHGNANYKAAGYGRSWEPSSTAGYHPRYNDGVWPYTAPVGSFSANAYGLYDMAGNVSEWTITMDSTGHIWYGNGQEGHIERGGDWGNDGHLCHCRGIRISGPAGGYLGLRTVHR